MPKRLFKKKVKTQVFGDDGQGYQWDESLTHKFSVERDDAGSPNKMKLEILNLSKESRAFIEADTKYVRFYAGHGEAELIFQGDVTQVETGSEGLESSTIIKSGDGQEAFNKGGMQQHFGGEMNFEDMIKRAGKSLGDAGKSLVDGAVKFGKNAGKKAKGTKQTFGATLSGSASQVMNDLTKSIGANWTIQDGEVLVYAEDDDTGEDAILLNSDTGLLSVKRVKGGLEVKALILPNARPRRLLKLESRDYTGFYVIRDVKHRGESAGGRRFFTTLEVKSI